MFQRRLLPALLISALAIVALLGACSPFSDDDDNPTATAPPEQSDPTATREVVMATFTPTEVVPPDQLTATAEAAGTSQAATREARDSLPTPTLAHDIDEEDILTPPQSRLETPSQLIDSYTGTFSWQFDDPDQTYADIQAPIVLLNQGDPAQVNNGDQIALRYYGEHYRTPPRQLEVAVYDYESNSATPLNPQTGEPAEVPAFAINADPVQTLRVDPADPTFTLEGFPPGHYVIWTQGRWGQHPALDRQLFVTWVFDIEIVE